MSARQEASFWSSQMDDMHEQLLLREAHHQRVMTLKSHASAEFGTAAWPAAASDSQSVETLQGFYYSVLSVYVKICLV